MRGLWIAALMVMVLPLASAELLFTQPQSAYNFGDELQMTLTLQPASEVTDFATVDLVCGSQKVTLYRSLLTVHGGAHQELPLNPRLDSPLFGSLNGTCLLEATFGNDDSRSSSFILTPHVEVSLVLPSTVLTPDTVFSVSGTARKANGQPLQGFARLTLEGANSSFTQPVYGGVFSFNTTLPAATRPGEHLLHVDTYEENSEGRSINYGSASSSVVVRVILSRGDIVLEESEVIPGDAFTFTVTAYDQADTALERDVPYDIYQPTGDQPWMSKLTKTGVRETVSLDTSAPAGYWKLEAQMGDLIVRKLFYVREHERIAFSLENNNTLVVTNTGNVPYRHSLEVLIGTYPIIKTLDLGVGESRRFVLKAPQAVYNVTVREGNNTFMASSLPLTGRAIAVGEVNGSFFNLWWAGLFIIGLLGITFLTNLYIARRRARADGGNMSSLAPVGSARTLPAASLAAGMTASGKREQAAVVAVRVDGKSALAQNALNTALGVAENVGASISQDTTHHVLMISPRFTKKLENDLLALQLAKEIEATLKGSSPDGTFAFGIGVGRGEIISDALRGNFTSLGSFVPSTKRLANASKNDVLISDELHAAVRTQIKAEKVASANAWRVTSLISRDSHKNFIDSFLKRQKK